MANSAKNVTDDAVSIERRVRATNKGLRRGPRRAPSKEAQAIRASRQAVNPVTIQPLPQQAAKAGLKTAAKTVGKTALKFLPGVGAALYGKEAYDRYQAGDIGGAVMSGGLAALSLSPIGFAGQIAGAGALAARDYYKAKKEAEAMEQDFRYRVPPDPVIKQFADEKKAREEAQAKEKTGREILGGMGVQFGDKKDERPVGAYVRTTTKTPRMQSLGNIKFDSNQARKGSDGNLIVQDVNSGKDYGVVRKSDGTYDWYRGSAGKEVPRSGGSRGGSGSSGGSGGSSTPRQRTSSGERAYETYERITGKKWSTAVAEGLTDGSAAGNLALQKRLLEQSKVDTTPVAPLPTNKPEQVTSQTVQQPVVPPLPRTQMQPITSQTTQQVQPAQTTQPPLPSFPALEEGADESQMRGFYLGGTYDKPEYWGGGAILSQIVRMAPKVASRVGPKVAGKGAPPVRTAPPAAPRPRPTTPVAPAPAKPAPAAPAAPRPVQPVQPVRPVAPAGKPPAPQPTPGQRIATAVGIAGTVGGAMMGTGQAPPPGGTGTGPGIPTGGRGPTVFPPLLNEQQTDPMVTPPPGPRPPSPRPSPRPSPSPRPPAPAPGPRPDYTVAPLPTLKPQPVVSQVDRTPKITDPKVDVNKIVRDQKEQERVARVGKFRDMIPNALQFAELLGKAGMLAKGYDRNMVNTAPISYRPLDPAQAMMQNQYAYNAALDQVQNASSGANQMANIQNLAATNMRGNNMIQSQYDQQNQQLFRDYEARLGQRDSENINYAHNVGQANKAAYYGAINDTMTSVGNIGRAAQLRMDSEKAAKTLVEGFPQIQPYVVNMLANAGVDVRGMAGPEGQYLGGKLKFVKGGKLTKPKRKKKK
jgi:molecular chaperone GrpE (heat shock protein)